jgi:hypothetical protein
MHLLACNGHKAGKCWVSEPRSTVPKLIFIAQAQSHAAAHAHSVIQQGSTTPRDHSSGNAGQVPRGYMSAAPSPLMNGAFYQGLMYPIPWDQGQPMSHSISQDGTAHTNPSTNPSSPSLNAAVPARRGLQRASVSNGSPSASIRSQSQPGARGMNQSMVMPIPVGYDASGLPLYQYPITDQTNRAYSAVSAGIPLMDGRSIEHQLYYFQDPYRQSQTQLPTSAEVPMTKVASHQDLAQRQDKVQPSLAIGSQKASRSPSPGGRERHDSTGLRSAPVTSAKFSQANVQQASDTTSNGTKSSSSLPSSGEGLLIVNGSYAPSHASDEPSRADVPLAVDAPSPDDLTNGYYFPDTPQQVGYPEYLPAMQDPDQMLQSATGYQIQTANMDPASTFNSPLQAFPAYIDAGLSLASQEEEMVMSPKTIQQSPWQSLHSSNLSALSSAAPKGKEAREHSRSPGSKAQSALGTVIETRTPSPSSIRKGENSMPVPPNPTPATNHQSMYSTTSEPVPPTPAPKTNQEGSKTVQLPHRPGVPQAHASSSLNPNNWHQIPGKKHSKRRRSKSGSNAKIVETPGTRGGEPLPEKEEDRKGG